MQQLKSAGVTLRVEQNQLVVDAPQGVINDELACKIRERESEFLMFLRQAKRSTEELPKIEATLAAREHGRFPLSHAQERLWFLQKSAPNQTAYNLSEVVRVRDSLNINALKNGLEQVVKRQTSLRTNFGEKDGKPYQRVQSYSMFVFQQADLSDLSEKASIAEARQMVYQLVKRPFNLNQESLFRALLIKVADDDHILTFVMHHLIADEGSFSLLWQELEAFYVAFDEVKGHGLPKLPIQYVDYAGWQRRELEGLFEEQLAYWRHQLAGELPTLELPLDYAPPVVQRNQEDVVKLSLSADTLTQLRQFSTKNNVTLFVTLLTGLNILLQKYTQQTDIIVGAPVAGRPKQQLEQLIGCFTNTVVLRNDLSSNPTVEALLAHACDVAFDAYANQMTPLAQVVADLQPEQYTSRTPIFQTFFVLQDGIEEKTHLGSLEIEPIDFQLSVADVDLKVCAAEQEDSSLRISARFNIDLFAPVTIERLLFDYEQILQYMMMMPTATLYELNLELADVQTEFQSRCDSDTKIHGDRVELEMDKSAARITTPRETLKSAVGAQGEKRPFFQRAISKLFSLK